MSDKSSQTTPDLVAQLRETRRMNVPYQLMMDAANEIERLRAKLVIAGAAT